MKTLVKPECAGLVLAAGASSRMGTPKALLRFDEGITLVEDQVRRLRAAGCDPVRVVTGCRAGDVASFCGAALCLENTAWQRGRVSSVVCGLQGLFPFEGCILLPVDTAGVRADTLARLHKGAGADTRSVRPYYAGKRGNCCWISGRLYEHITALDCSGEDAARLDALLRPLEQRLDVDDPAVLNNFNSPEEWAAFCAGGGLTDG
jgi:CTP:molybdopterin cytidylyltransferase MocA